MGGSSGRSLSHLSNADLNDIRVSLFLTDFGMQLNRAGPMDANEFCLRVLICTLVVEL